MRYEASLGKCRLRGDLGSDFNFIVFNKKIVVVMQIRISVGKMEALL